MLGRGRLGGDEALLEDVRLAGHLAVGINLLEAQEVESQRVVREPLGGEHGEVLLGVDAAVALEEGVVFGGEPGDGLLDLVVVRAGVALEGEQRAGAVAKQEHGAGALGAGLAAAGREGFHGVFRAIPDAAMVSSLCEKTATSSSPMSAAARSAGICLTLKAITYTSSYL